MWPHPLYHLPLRNRFHYIFLTWYSNMEQQEVKDKLKTGEMKRQTRRGKSEVWKGFKLMVEDDTETCSGFAECDQCGALLSYKSRKTGTLTLTPPFHISRPAMERRYAFSSTL